MSKLKIATIVVSLLLVWAAGYFALRVRSHGSRIGEVRKISYRTLDFSNLAFSSWEGELAQSGGHLGLSDAENGNIWHFSALNDPVVCAKLKKAMRMKHVFELQYTDLRFHIGYASNYVVYDVLRLNPDTGESSELHVTEAEIKHGLD